MKINPIRIDSPLFWKYNDGEIPKSPKQINIIEIDRYLARDLNTLWHSQLPIYETGFCFNSKISFGALYKNVYYATAIWTNPIAANLPQQEWLELRRLAISQDAPKYTASYMLGKMAKIIKKSFSEIKTLVSYQDIKVHKGGSWNRPNSKNKNGTPRIRPDKNNAIGPKQRWIYKL